MSPKEKLTPGDFQRSIDSMQLLADFANGATVFPTADTELSDEYRNAVLQYGNYFVEVFSNTEFSNLLFNSNLNRIRNGQISVARLGFGSFGYNRDSECKRINIRKNSEVQPQLYFAILGDRNQYLGDVRREQEFKQFQSQILGKYGNVDNNPWGFRRIRENRSPGLSDEYYYEASRLLKPEDLLNNALLRSFVIGMNGILGNAEKKAMLEKVGTTDEGKVREIIGALIEANKILQPVLNPKQA